MRKRSFSTLSGIVVAALVLAGCGGEDEGAEDPPVADTEELDFAEGSTMAALAEQGSITIGTKFDQPGFGLQNLEGEVEGFDVEVGKIIAGGLGISPDDITWEEAPSAQREQLIEDGTVDIVVATYTINEERAQRIAFAGPYYVAGQQLMVKSDNDVITGPEDLADNPDQTVCSVTGSTPSEQIKEYLASDDQLVLFDVYERCESSLGNDQVQVVTTDNVILLGFVSESDGDYKLVGEQFTEEPYGIGLTHGDTEFCEWINETLAENEEAYNEAWASTAGAVEGAEAPTLPEAAPCA